jgi:hypothetical protein
MLYRRVYFLFHDEAAARSVINELKTSLAGEDYQLHTLVKGSGGFARLPDAAVEHAPSLPAWAQDVLWYLSVCLFAAGLIAMVLALLAMSWLWVLVFGVIVIATQISGYLFTNRIPSAQFDRFRTALDHDEILLVVDVPYRRVREVKQRVYDRHPEARTNGINWHINAFGL